MRDKIAITENLRRFLVALEELRSRAHCEEGMGLLHGTPGQGKTTALGLAVDKTSGIYLRAKSLWTPNKLLRELCVELDLPALSSSAAMLDSVVREMVMEQKPLFIDEADYLMNSVMLFDLVRDIYDLARTPVILVGMPGFKRKIKNDRWARHARRITQVVEFSGLTLADVALVAREVCEITIADDLIKHIHKETEGNIGYTVTGLRKIETLARASSLTTVDKKQWGSRSLFLGN
jgi:hypothetical protein